MRARVGATLRCRRLCCPSSKMRLTTKVRVSNGSGGSVSGDLQIEICGMQQCVTSLLRPSRGSLYGSLSPICSIAKTLISLGLRSDVFLVRDKTDAGNRVLIRFWYGSEDFEGVGSRSEW